MPLHFTETTVVSGKRQRGKPWQTNPEGEATQARETVRFYETLFSHPSVEAITWWDFSDNGAWQGAPAGFVRKDMSPKPVYNALMKKIKGDWWTKTTIKTDKKGRAAIRGFLGDYKVSAKGKTKSCSIGKDQPNRWALSLD